MGLRDHVKLPSEIAQKNKQKVAARDLLKSYPNRDGESAFVVSVSVTKNQDWLKVDTDSDWVAFYPVESVEAALLLELGDKFSGNWGNALKCVLDACNRKFAANLEVDRSSSRRFYLFVEDSVTLFITEREKKSLSCQITLEDFGFTELNACVTITEMDAVLPAEPGSVIGSESLSDDLNGKPRRTRRPKQSSV